jgi:glycerol-3-phosphate dehydrogenase
MTHTTTVLIVGGGGTGTGAARDLAARGIDVTLVERGGLASGTSGRSHGLLHSGARYAESDPAGAVECREENETLRRIGGHCVDDTGGLFLQLDGDDPEYFRAKLDACREHGIDATVVDGDEARARVPGLSDAVERALVVPDAVIYPSRLTAANAESAANNGATVYTDAPVEDIVVADGEIDRVEIGGDVAADIEPEYVVNATGPWADEVGSLAGVDFEMKPTKGVMVSVPYDGLGPVLNRCREPADGDIVIPHDGEVVLGTTSVEVEDPDEFAEEQWEIDRMYRECADMLPPVRDRDAIRTWWGCRPLYAPDESGRSDSGEGDERGISRDFVLLDHEGDGVDNFASIVGGKLTTYRIMAEAVADHVCDVLGVDAESTTAEERLPGADDPAELDRLVAKYSEPQPTDAGVVGRSSVTAEDD